MSAETTRKMRLFMHGGHLTMAQEQTAQTAQTTQQQHLPGIGDLRDPKIRANPYPLYDRMRERGAIFWDEAAGNQGGWAVMSHHLVTTALRDPRVAAERLEAPPSFDWAPEQFRTAVERVFRAMPHQLLFIDPPDHTRLRGLINKAFTPRMVENMRQRITELTNERLDAIERAGKMEVIEDLAYPLPAIVIAEMLGVPPEDRD